MIRMKFFIISICVITCLIQSCAPTPELRLFDDIITIKIEAQSRYRNFYCDPVKSTDSKALRGTVLGLKIRVEQRTRQKDTVLVMLPDGCFKQKENIREIALNDVVFPARLVEMVKNSYDNYNRVLTYNNVTGIPELRDVPVIDTCDCETITQETAYSKPCKTPSCKPYFMEARVIPGLFSYADKPTVSRDEIRRDISYEVVAGVRVGGAYFDFAAFLDAFLKLKVGIEADINCPCIRTDTVYITEHTTVHKYTKVEASDSVCVTSTTDTTTEGYVGRHNVRYVTGETEFVAFNPYLRLFAMLDGDFDGGLRAKLGLIKRCSPLGIGLAYTTAIPVYNEYSARAGLDIVRPVTMLHVRYDFARISCIKPFCYTQFGTSLDKLTLDLWKYNVNGNDAVDNAIQTIEQTCASCTINTGGGTVVQLPSIRSAVGGLPISYGFGIGIEYPLWNTFDVAIDFGFRSLAVGEAITYGNVDLPIYRRVNMWRLRAGVTL